MVMVPAIQLHQLLFCSLTLKLFVQTCYSAKGIHCKSSLEIPLMQSYKDLVRERD